MVFNFKRGFVSGLIILQDRIPVPYLGQPHASFPLIAENERTSMKTIVVQSTDPASASAAAIDQLSVLRRGLTDLLDPDDLSEL
jgi:hypothetical protein